MAAGATIALIDVREHGEYNSAHIPGASLLPRRLLEYQMEPLVPFKGVRVIVCDDDGRRAALAADTLERMGYGQVSVLGGGTNRWVSEGYPTEWGMNVPSKDFGEKLEVVHHVPGMDAQELHDRVARGDKLVILDTRTPEEYLRACIPGGRSVPGGELALRIPDIMKDLDPDTTIVINCAGRTRSIVGTRSVQRMGVPNIYGLRNGTSGWILAGLELEYGADRLELPPSSEDGLAAAEAYAARLADEDGVGYITPEGLQELQGKAATETVYLIDVRTEEEYRQGHVPGFQWFPGGQAVQRADDVVAVRDGTIVFACDGKVRSTVAASWYRQMGFPNAYALEGGTGGWAARGLPLEQGMPEEVPFGSVEARERVPQLSPEEMQSRGAATVIFVGTSRWFARGHVPGSHWVPRGWLEDQIGAVAAGKGEPIAVTCSDGVASVLAGATLMEMGYPDVSVLGGGVNAWRKAGLPVETGLTGVMTPPVDVVVSGTDRTYADMMQYLRWEEELGRKYETRPG